MLKDSEEKGKSHSWENCVIKWMGMRSVWFGPRPCSSRQLGRCRANPWALPGGSKVKPDAVGFKGQAGLSAQSGLCLPRRPPRSEGARLTKPPQFRLAASMGERAECSLRSSSTVVSDGFAGVGVSHAPLRGSANQRLPLAADPPSPLRR